MQEVCILDEYMFGAWAHIPQIGSQIFVGCSDGSLSSGTGVDIFNTRHCKEFLRNRSTNDPSTSWCRNQPHCNGATLSSHLTWYCMWVTDHITPISFTNRDNREFGLDDSSTDGSSYFLCTFHTKTNMAFMITHGYDCLETSTLTGTCLFLNWTNFQNFILENRSQNGINDFKLLDRETESVDIFQRCHFAGLHETSKMGNRLPRLGCCGTTTSSVPATTTASSSTTTTESTTESTTRRSLPM